MFDENEETEAKVGFIPEANEAEVVEDVETEIEVGSELESFESASIEEVEFIEDARVESIIESILFASDRPVSFASLKQIFKHTNVKSDRVRRALDRLSVEYAGAQRGVSLEEVPGGYQLKTKIDNMQFLRGQIKARVFKLSGPALEVLAIVAYKQPMIKSEIDEIRGVESGHLLRALMEKGLVQFEGKSELPGRPMQYGTTKKFLEIFGLRNLKELPTLSQIDELLPDGIGEDEPEEKLKLSDITETLSEKVGESFSQGEDELVKIQFQLEEIAVTSQFFEEEKKKQKERAAQDKAQNIRDALTVGEEVSTRELNWLKKYDEALAAGSVMDENKEMESEVEVAVSEGLFEEEAPHIEDEIPFVAEADDEPEAVT